MLQPGRAKECEQNALMCQQSSGQIDQSKVSLFLAINERLSKKSFATAKEAVLQLSKAVNGTRNEGSGLYWWIDIAWDFLGL